MNAPTLASVGVRRRQRRRKLTENRLAAKWCEALLVITVLASVLAIGTVHVQVLLGVSLLALVGGALGLLAFRRPPTPAIVLAALGLFSLLQAIPLPAPWTRWLSPAGAQIWLRCLTPFRESPLTRFPISLDGGATVTEALKWFTYAAVYLMAARVRLQRSTAWLALLVFASSSAVSLITLWHGAKNLQLVYGVYQPHFAVGRWNVGPLLNSNNLAGYASLGLFAGAGLLLSRNSKTPSKPLFAGLCAIITAMLLSGSRAALLSALVGSGIIGFWLYRRDRPKLTPAQMAMAAGPLTLGVVLFALLGGRQEWQALGAANVERKLAVWRWSLPMLHDHAWFGIGRGAFETAFPAYRLGLARDWTAVFSHAENFVVQWLTEWGIPIGLCAIVTVVAYVSTELYAARAERLRLLLLTGIAVLLLQNLMDLGLEIPSLVIAAVVTLAAGERPLRHAHTPNRNIASISAGGMVVAMGVVWLIAFKSSRWPVEDERRAASVSYHALVESSSNGGPGLAGPEAVAFREQLHAAMLRHPGEPYFPLLGAALASRTHLDNPLPWIARALELAPSNGPAHLILADLLRTHRANVQAMLHLRMAAEYDGTLAGLVSARIAQWAPTLDVLQQAIPRGPNGPDVLAGACEALPATELKVSCLRYAIGESPKPAKLLGDLAEALLLALKNGAAPCTKAQSQECFNEIDRVARRLAKVDPRSWRSQYLIAKNLEAQGNFKDAAAIMNGVCPAGVEGQQCTTESVATAIASGLDPVILTAADAYAARSCADRSACAAAFDWLGKTLDAGGKRAFAMNYLTKAAETESTTDRWIRVAKRAADMRLISVARTALDRADRSPDATQVTRAATGRLRSEVDGRSTLGL